MIKPWHVVVLVLVVVLLFGSRRLPDLAKSVGESLKIFKNEVKDLTHDESGTAQPSDPTPAQPAATPPVTAPPATGTTTPPAASPSTTAAPSPSVSGAPAPGEQVVDPATGRLVPRDSSAPQS